MPEIRKPEAAAVERIGRIIIVPGVAHEGFKILEPVKEFFASALEDYRRTLLR